LSFVNLKWNTNMRCLKDLNLIKDSDQVEAQNEETIIILQANRKEHDTSLPD